MIRKTHNETIGGGRLGSDGSTGHPFRLAVKVPSWYEDALCAQIDQELFYPEKGGSTRTAKKVCAECPVATQCLDAALERDERHGIWGGRSERERRKLQLERKAS